MLRRLGLTLALLAAGAGEVRAQAPTSTNAVQIKPQAADICSGTASCVWVKSADGLLYYRKSDASSTLIPVGNGLANRLALWGSTSAIGYVVNGTDGQFLKLVSGVPTWSDLPQSGHTIKVGSTTYTQRSILAFSSAFSGNDNSGANATEIDLAAVGTAGGGTAGTYAFPDEIVTDDKGRVTSVTEGDPKALQSLTLTAGTGLTGGGDLSANRSFALTNTITAGSCTYCALTYDAQGRLSIAASGTTPPLGSGTTNTLPLWTGSGTLGDSLLSQSGGLLVAGAGIRPDTDNAYALGTSALRWSDIHASAVTVHADNTDTSALYLNPDEIEATGRLNIYTDDGATAGDPGPDVFLGMGSGVTGNSTVAGGYGGRWVVQTGNGGDGTATQSAGWGGDIDIRTGTPGVDNGGGGARGGAFFLQTSSGTGGEEAGNISFVAGHDGEGRLELQAASILIGSTSATDIELTGPVKLDGDLLPDPDNTYSLGSASKRFASVHVGPGSVVVHNDATDTNKASLKFSSSTAQLVTDASTPLQLTTGSNAGITINTNGSISFGNAGSSGYVLTHNGSSAPTWQALPSTTAGHVIQNPAGTDLTQRGHLAFTGAFTNSDSSGSDRTTIDLAAVGTANTYAYPDSLTTDAYGRVSSVTAGSAKALQSTTITAGTGLSGGGDLSTNRSFALANTAVSAGSYTYGSFTVDAQGRLTAASSGTTPLTGSLSSGVIPRATGSTTLSDGSITDSGSAIGLTQNVSLTTGKTFTSDYFKLNTSAPYVQSQAAFAVGTAQTVGFSLENTTAAALGATQGSPAIEWIGRQWRTDGTGSSTVKWLVQNRPVQASNFTVDELVFWADVNGSYSEKLAIRARSDISDCQFFFNNGNGSLFAKSGSLVRIGAGGTASLDIDNGNILSSSQYGTNIGSSSQAFKNAWSRQYNGVEQAVSYSSGTLTLNVASGETIVTTLSASAGTVVMSAGNPDEKMVLYLKQDSTGGRTITWPSNARFGTTFGTPLLSTAASAVDLFEFRYNNTDSKWDCIGMTLNLGAAVTPVASLQGATKDAATSSVTNVAWLNHTSSGTAAAGYGTGILLSGQDASGNADDMLELATAWNGAASGNENSRLQAKFRVAGAALGNIHWFVGGDGSSNIYQQVSNASGTAKMYLGVVGTAGNFASSSAVGDAFVRSQQDFYIATGTGGTSRLKVDSSGNYTFTPNNGMALGANLTNNVTSGGSNNTIANFTDLVTYANDAAAIRNDIYQLARSLKIIQDGLRTLGLSN